MRRLVIIWNKFQKTQTQHFENKNKRMLGWKKSWLVPSCCLKKEIHFETMLDLKIPMDVCTDLIVLTAACLLFTSKENKLPPFLCTVPGEKYHVELIISFQCNASPPMYCMVLQMETRSIQLVSQCQGKANIFEKSGTSIMPQHQRSEEERNFFLRRKILKRKIVPLKSWEDVRIPRMVVEMHGRIVPYHSSQK
ncbi:unnamed protein product [Allacma fusca]|uniref:Uncharacterized protein n=1 Tax=Allacma fusca TaxID=39272 RepID=A0A8J2PCZ3_9HEXA|nr:unnamed protein product [Allacma fusca]